MDLRRKPNGKWEVRWREASRRRGRTFDRKGDAADFIAWTRQRNSSGRLWSQKILRFMSL